MNLLSVTPVYAALIVALFLFLSARVITYRRDNLISLGDQGDKQLLKRIRAHANFTEYAPLCLLLLVLLELQGAPALLLHLLGVMLLVGRITHGYALSRTPTQLTLRVLGMGLTLAQLGLSAIALVFYTVI